MHKQEMLPIKLKFLAISIILAISLSLAGPSFDVSARPLAAVSPTLGAAATFAILGATAITNIPNSAITGDVGLSPAAGGNYAGLTTTDMVTGTIYAVDGAGPAGSVNNPALLTSAQAANTAAFGALIAPPNAACTTNYGAVTQDLTGLSLGPGVYCASAFQLTGVLTLTDTTANDVWVFRSDLSTLNTTPGGGASVRFLNGIGSPCNVWWRVASSATIGSGTAFIGNILALTSISLGTNASLTGRALAQTGAVTLDQNTITAPVCGAAPGLNLTTNASGPVTVGGNIRDTAHLVGGIGTLGGTLTFEAFAPGDTTCSLAPAATMTVTVSGAGDYPSPTFAASQVGSYRWVVHYSGDANNLAINTACNAAGETSTVNAVPPTSAPPSGPEDTAVPPTAPPALTATPLPIVTGLPATGGAPIRSEDFPWSLVIIASGFSVMALVLGIRVYRSTYRPRQ